MTSQQLRRWSALHERRARSWWTSPWLLALACGGVLATFVAWRVDAAGPIAASHGWLAATIVMFALAFLRVPFHIYWRSDAALLAQLPIEGRALFDVALARCVRAAAATSLAVLVGATPLAGSMAIFVRHAIFAGALGLAAAFLLPAVTTWAAMLVAVARTMRSSPGAILGALPGFASSVVIVAVLIASSSWLLDTSQSSPGDVILGILAGVSVVAIVAVRTTAPPVMGTILRDVSALDRQRLAMLEIHPPTAIERGITAMLGEAALPYRKDAVLMRRRYPMAYALGALAFIVLAIVGLSRPANPTPWLGATLGGAMVYGFALARRLSRPPIELQRLAATLPITRSARRRAKVAWVAGWVGVFIAIPALFALWRVG